LTILASLENWLLLAQSSSARRACVSAEENKDLVRKYFEEAWSKGNVAAVDEFMAADYVEHPIPSGLPPGTEGTKQLITTYRSAFPDLKTTLDDIFAEGDSVAFRWSFRGTHLGDWLDIPPTGNHVTANGITVFRIAGGKVVESWTSVDLNPSEEEVQWLTEGGGWPRSGDIPPTQGDTSPPIWDVLTRNLTWRFRVAEARERERIEQELRSSDPTVTPARGSARARGLAAVDPLPTGSGGGWRLLRLPGAAGWSSGSRHR
jgi:steroid delta-isomerase-like uncharacterized protein